MQVKLYKDAGGAVGRIEVFDRRRHARLGELTQPATGFAIAREGARFAAIGAHDFGAADRARPWARAARVLAADGVGAKLLNQRLIGIPELQRKLNLQIPQRTPLLEKINPKRLLQRKTDEKSNQKIDQSIERQIDRTPRLRPNIPSGPGGGLTPRMPGIPNIGR